MRSFWLLALVVLAWYPASLAAAQLRVATGAGAGGLTCADATACSGAADCGAGETCAMVDTAGACLPAGGTLCCTADADCPAPVDGAVSCALASGATEGICVTTRDQENDDCTSLFALPEMAAPCFGATGLADGDCDEDGVPNDADNCRCTANADQRDCDQDGLGAICERAPNPSLRLPREACDGAQTYEELSCIRTMCGCYEISGRDDPWCATEACRALPSVARFVDSCGSIGRDAGARADGGTGRPDAGPPRADMGTAPRDAAAPSADSGAMDSGPTSGSDDDGGCSAAPGASVPGTPWPLVLGAVWWVARRRRRG